jgi:hypothetical protein
LKKISGSNKSSAHLGANLHRHSREARTTLGPAVRVDVIECIAELHRLGGPIDAAGAVTLARGRHRYRTYRASRWGWTAR